jgi:outer membrane protein OmpA-like peptidoglycan-associated protein
MLIILPCLAGAPSSFAQQKGQWVPGQYGLNAGVIPDPGITYANLALNYSADRLNGPNGNSVPGINGTYSFWVDENIFYYVPKHKFLGGYYMPYVALVYANGEVVANITGTNLTTGAGGSGFSDMFVEPFNLGWHIGKRLDFNVGYAFVAPTGRFTQGASNNTGSGYWGNDLTTGSTFYLTKNKGTTANLATALEFHGQKSGTDITPGRAFTMEWGVGQILPLKKDFSRLLQFGLVGYDQWQVSKSSGTLNLGGIPVPESSIPFYSVHAVGVQSNFILPAKAFSAFFKYYDEYRALARPQGRTFVFGFAWTLRIPRPQPPQANRPPSAACSASKPSVYVGSNESVSVTASGTDPDNDPLTYTWTANGGSVDGSGPSVRWDSSGVAAGNYRVTANVSDGKGGTTSCAADIRVEPKPNIAPTMSCSAERSSVLTGERVNINARASDADGDPLTYSWRTSGGQVVGSGENVQLDTTGVSPGSYTVTGRVEDGRGGAADCSVNLSVAEPPAQALATKINECDFHGASARVDNVCKRILDDVALRLQNEPKTTVVLVGYGNPGEHTAGANSAAQAAKYLVEKGIADSRIIQRAAEGQSGAQNHRVEIIWVPEGAAY